MVHVFNINDIAEGSAKGFMVKQKKIFAVKKAGQLYLYLNQCPHLNITLEFQPDNFLDTEKQYIQCVNHGALFIIENGKCIAGPCSGQSLTPVNFKIEGDQVFLLSELDD